MAKEGSLFCAAERLVKETEVVVSPYIRIWQACEGYVRMSLVKHYKRFHDALS